MKKTLLSLSAALCALPMFAQQISVDEATRTAQLFFGTDTRSAAPVELAYTSAANGKNHFFVFNSPANNGGFVIVGADMAAKEVLGYSTTGTFDINNIPDNFRWWLSQYDLQIEEGIKQGVNSREVKSGTRATKTSIEPLITTKWDQGYPFNNAIPTLSSSLKENQTCVTGCVATAIAQIMNYHKWPTSGSGSNSYKLYYKIDKEGYCEYPPLNQVSYDYYAEKNPDKLKEYTITQTFGANFGTFDWNNMLDVYDMYWDYDSQKLVDEFSDKQRDAVAKLMYHVGVSVDMNYSPSASGAVTSKAVTVLPNNFGYDKSIHALDREYYTDNEWENIIYKELSEKRPVLYSGDSERAGHAFICDGYSLDEVTKNMYHFNWGWGGYCDGYYDISGANALKPNGSGIGGAGDDAQYTEGQEIIIGIMKDAGGDYFFELYWSPNYENGTPKPIISETSFERGSDIKFNGYFRSGLKEENNVEKAVKFVNKKSGDIKYITLEIGWEITVNSGSLEEGEYDFSFVYRVNRGDWKEIKNPITVERPTLTITTSKEEYILTSTPTFGNNNYVTDNIHDLNLLINIKNNTSSPITKHFLVWLAEVTFTDGGYSWSYKTYQDKEITIPAQKEVSEVISFENYSDSYSLDKNKNYLFTLEDYTNRQNLINEFFYVVGKETIDFTISDSGYGTLILPFEAEIPEGLNAYICESNNGDDLVLRKVDKLDLFTPYILSGTPDSYTFSGPNVPGEDSYRAGLLKGILTTDYTLKADDYVLQTQNSITRFYKVGSKAGKTATQYRCVLNIPSGTAMSYSSFGFGDVGGTTEIEEVEDKEPVVTGIYSIDGTYHTSLQKGINIVRKSDGTTVKILVK